MVESVQFCLSVRCNSHYKVATRVEDEVAGLLDMIFQCSFSFGFVWRICFG